MKFSKFSLVSCAIAAVPMFISGATAQLPSQDESTLVQGYWGDVKIVQGTQTVGTYSDALGEYGFTQIIIGNDTIYHISQNVLGDDENTFTGVVTNTATHDDQELFEEYRDQYQEHVETLTGPCNISCDVELNGPYIDEFGEFDPDNAAIYEVRPDGPRKDYEENLKNSEKEDDNGTSATDPNTNGSVTPHGDTEPDIDGIPTAKEDYIATVKNGQPVEGEIDYLVDYHFDENGMLVLDPDSITEVIVASNAGGGSTANGNQNGGGSGLDPTGDNVDSSIVGVSSGDDQSTTFEAADYSGDGNNDTVIISIPPGGGNDNEEEESAGEDVALTDDGSSDAETSDTETQSENTESKSVTRRSRFARRGQSETATLSTSGTRFSRNKTARKRTNSTSRAQRRARTSGSRAQHNQRRARVSGRR